MAKASRSRRHAGATPRYLQAASTWPTMKPGWYAASATPWRSVSSETTKAIASSGASMPRARDGAEDVSELRRARAPDLDLVGDAAQEGGVHQLARRHVGGEDHQLVEGQREALAGVQLHEVPAVRFALAVWSLNIVGTRAS